MSYDSLQITATGLAQRPALARRWRGEQALGLETLKNVANSRPSPNAGREAGVFVTTGSEIFRLAKP
jgi:hypothetical protein